MALVASRCLACATSATRKQVSLSFCTLATYISNLSSLRYEESCWKYVWVTMALTERVLDHAGGDHKVPTKISEVNRHA